MKTLSLVIPIYNEEENIPELYRRIKSAIDKDFSQFKYEIILVDDGSSDNSLRLLEELNQKDKNVIVITFSRNFGHHIAITAGLDHASGDYVVIMDGDLQDQPEEILKLYNKLQEGYEVVYGERLNKKFGLKKRFLSFLFNWMIKKLIHEKIIINSTIFRIMTRDVVASIRQLRERNRYIVGLIGWVGYNQTVQYVEHGKRFKGKTKYNLSKQFLLAFNAIFSFSEYFLQLIIKIGLGFVALSILVIGYVLIRKFVYHSPIPGWSSLIISLFMVGGIQIILMGVIGQYIGRIYVEAKNRPLYVIKKVVR